MNCSKLLIGVAAIVVAFQGSALAGNNLTLQSTALSSAITVALGQMPNDHPILRHPHKERPPHPAKPMLH